MSTWNTRHIHKKPEKKEKGPVKPEKETDKLELFFCHLYEFHFPAPSAPAFVPAELPPRYAIDFGHAVPLHTPVVSSPAVPTISSATDCFIVSSVNFAVPATPVVPASDVTSPAYSVVSSANFVILLTTHSYVL